MKAVSLRRQWIGLTIALLLATGHWLLTPAAQAHPVPRRSYDRTIRVHLSPEAVVVDYRLELDEWTAIYVDLDAVRAKVDLTKLSKPSEFYEAFTRCYGPILAANLIATLDDKPLEFTCVEHQHKVLDHLRCDFVFKAEWQPAPGLRHRFAFREGNYELETGRVQLSLTNDPALSLSARIEPDAALKARPASELKPGDDARLRNVSATVLVPAGAEASAIPTKDLQTESGTASNPLLALLDESHGFWMLLILAAGIGAIHALTPGHGKTMVAAYLIGERGTVWHALLLGVVTTLTHTGVVLTLAAVLWLCFPGGKMSASTQQSLHTTLELIGGLLLAGLGCWLLLRRLSGGADHFHWGGEGHHHHHGHSHGGHWHSHGGAAHVHDHDHDHHSAEKQPVGWWGLVVMGISGGIVPCWDAIGLLLYTVAVNQLWLALPMLLAFSAGLAAILVAIGIGVVHAGGLLGARWAEGRLVRALPVLSALLIAGMGMWICYDSLNPTPADSSVASRSAPTLP